MTKVLFLVRHGEVEGWRPGMLLGSSDAPLSEVGRKQAALVRDMIPADAGRFVCSPLARTRETADIVANGRDVVVETDADLREIGFGEWEGLTYDEVAKDYPLLIKGWSEFRPDFAFPQGESLEDFGCRIERAAQSLAEAAAATVVAITHGGVIRSLVCHFLGLPIRDYLLFEVAPGSVTTLRLWGGRGVLTGLCSPDAMAHSGRPHT
jgi:alpha-ribazole phosphatase